MNKELLSGLDAINKKFGNGTISTLAGKAQKIEVIPTTIPSIDKALGVGGIPRGRITEIFGQESSGKTTVCLQTIANAQKMGLSCVFLDLEHAMSPEYAESLGVDLDSLLVSQPSSAENVFEVMEALINSGQVDLIVLDSVAALCVQAEINGDFGDAIMGVLPKLMSQAMRKLTPSIEEKKVAVMFINQVRSKMSATAWGNPNTTTGGMALKFYSTIRMEITRIGSVKKGEEVVGNRTRVKVVKNKVAPPFKTCEFDIIFGEGASREADILQNAIDCGLIDQKGSWFSYGDVKLGQGKDSVRELLKDNSELCDELMERILDNEK